MSAHPVVTVLIIQFICFLLNSDPTTLKTSNTTIIIIIIIVMMMMIIKNSI